MWEIRVVNKGLAEASHLQCKHKQTLVSGLVPFMLQLWRLFLLEITITVCNSVLYLPAALTCGEAASLDPCSRMAFLSPLIFSGN